MAFGNFEFPNASVYDSDLREVLRIIKKLTDSYNDIVETVNEVETLSEETKAQVLALKVELENALGTIDDKIAKLLKEAISEYQGEIDAINIKIDMLNTKYDGLKDYVDNVDNENRIWTLLSITSITAKLQTQINELYDLVKENYTVYNPLRALWQNANKAVNDLYEAERYGGLTNAELSHYDMTNEQFAQRNLCNYDIAINLRWILEDYGVRRTVHPAYGTRTIPYNADSFIWTEFLGTMSNEQFINLDLTNEEFAALNLTNQEYMEYRANPRYLDGVGFVDTSGSGLTNNEMGTLGIHA